MKKQFGDGIAIMRSNCILELIADTTGNMGSQVLKLKIRNNVMLNSWVVTFETSGFKIGSN